VFLPSRNGGNKVRTVKTRLSQDWEGEICPDLPSSLAFSLATYLRLRKGYKNDNHSHFTSTDSPLPDKAPNLPLLALHIQLGRAFPSLLSQGDFFAQKGCNSRSHRRIPPGARHSTDAEIFSNRAIGGLLQAYEAS